MNHEKINRKNDILKKRAKSHLKAMESIDETKSVPEKEKQVAKEHIFQKAIKDYERQQELETSISETEKILQTGDNSQKRRENEEQVFNFDKYFNNIYHQLETESSKPEPRKKVSTILYDAEREIGKILRGFTGNPNITVEITSDDPQELYDMDWHYPPYLMVYNGPKEWNKYYPERKRKIINSMEIIHTQEEFVEFVEQNKLPKNNNEE